MALSVSELVAGSLGSVYGIFPRDVLLDIVVTYKIRRDLDQLSRQRGWSISKAAFLAASVGLLALADGEVMTLERFKEELGPLVVSERRDRRVVFQVTAKVNREIRELAEAQGWDMTKAAFLLIVLGLDVLDQVLAQVEG